MGRGNIDYTPVFGAAAHIKHYFIEQGDFNMPPIDAIRISADYMKKMRI